jgi:SAM-dependent methyltransferase
MFAVLTDPAKADRQWNPEDFFRTGEEEVAEALSLMSRLGMPIRSGRALDFGCGVGRLTQALAKHFGSVVGVDVAPSMIDGARRLNRAGEKVSYLLNQEDHLHALESSSFDLVYTHITLQHIRPRYIRRYLVEFARVLSPGGHLLFQLPAGRTPSGPTWKRAIRRLVPPAITDTLLNWRTRRLAAGSETPPMEMHSLPDKTVRRILRHLGLRLVHVENIRPGESVWLNYRYFASK